MSDIWLAGETLPADSLNTWVQSGTVEVPIVNALAGNADITFPYEFADVPGVAATVTHGTFTGSAAVYAVRIGNLTTTGCRVRIHRVDSTTPITNDIVTSWVAVGRPV